MYCIKNFKSFIFNSDTSNCCIICPENADYSGKDLLDVAGVGNFAIASTDCMQCQKASTINKSLLDNLVGSLLSEFTYIISLLLHCTYNFLQFLNGLFESYYLFIFIDTSNYCITLQGNIDNCGNHGLNLPDSTLDPVKVNTVNEKMKSGSGSEVLEVSNANCY